MSSILVVILLGLMVGVVAHVMMPSESRGAWRVCALLGVGGALAAYAVIRAVTVHDLSSDWLAMHGAAIGGIWVLATYRLVRTQA